MPVTARERAEELNALLRDPQVRCIMSTIGGSNSNALLPYLDYAAFRRDPKIVVGYSDATAVLLALYAQTGIPTFYGPALVASLGVSLHRWWMRLGRLLSISSANRPAFRIN